MFSSIQSHSPGGIAYVRSMRKQPCCRPCRLRARGCTKTPRALIFQPGPGGSSERVCVCFTNVHADVCLSDTLLSGQSPSRQCLSWAAVPMESAIVAAHLIFLGDRRSGGCGRRRTTKIGDPNRRGAIGLRRSTAVVVEFDACGSLSDKQQAWLVSRGPGPRTSRLLCHDAPPADGVSPLRDLRSGEAGETPFNSGCSRRLDVVNGCNI